MGWNSAYPLWPDGNNLRVLRPLIAMQREQLRAELRQKKLGWIEDVTNQDRRYARVRVRQHLAKISKAGFRSQLAKSSISQLQAIARIEEDQVSQLMHRSVTFSRFGYALIEAAKLGWVSDTVLAKLLERVMLGVSGNNRAKHQGQQLVKTWDILCDRPRSVNGCLLRWKSGTVLVFRDPGAVCGRGKTPAKKVKLTGNSIPVVFDQRWLVRSTVVGTLMPFATCRDHISAKQIQALMKIPFPARDTTPVLRTQSGEYQVLPIVAPGQIDFIGALRGLETGTQFA